MNNRYRSVDMIKGIAMLMVILSHYGQCFDSWECLVFQFFRMGCSVFFVASGFSIMCLLSKSKYTELNANNYLRFMSSRVKAFAPGWYLGILIVFLANSLSLHINGNALSFGNNREGISILCNILFLHGFLPFCNSNVMPGGWYIGATMILYSITPLILVLIKPIKKRWLTFIGLTLISILLNLLLMVIFKESYTSNDFYYYFFATHFPEYLLGLILYYDFIENKLTKNAYKLMILGLSVLVVAVIIFYLYPRSISQVLSAWITGIATYFILYFLLSNEKQKKTFSVTALVTIGRSSYYIYLLNAFFTFTFTKDALRILGEMGVASDWSFVVLLPVVILLSVEAGLLMQKTVRLILPVLRKIYTAAS